jgi:hypothetical protein
MMGSKRKVELEGDISETNIMVGYACYTQLSSSSQKEGTDVGFNSCNVANQ